MAETALSLVPPAPGGDKYEKLLARFAASGFPPLIVAVGLQDQLLYALERHQAPTRVLTLEPIASAAQHALARPTWRSWIEAGRLTVLVGPHYTGYADAWRLIAKGALQPPMIVDPDLLEQHPAETEGAKAVAKQIVRGARANEEARKRFAGGYLLNTLANLPVIASEGDAAAVRDLFPNLPAIVIGAGPSLDRNLPAISRLQNRALLIAVDTAVRPLLAAGIRPHLVVSVDPTAGNARHLNDLPEVRGLWLVAEGSLASSVFPQFAGRTFICKISSHDPWPWLASEGCDRAELKSWGSVLTTAFDLAISSGCDPIVFAGADLAYTDGLQYCRNTVYEPDWSPFPTDAERAAKFAEYLAARPHGPQPDLRGGEVTTAPHFVQFRDWILGRAESIPSRRIINATGAGILHGGRVECDDFSVVDWLEETDGDDLRERLAEAWTQSTHGRSSLLEGLERATAYGTAIPLQRWHGFGGDTASLDQIRATTQNSAARLQFDRRKTEYLARHRESYDNRISSLDDARELSHGNYEAAARRAVSQQAHTLLDFMQRTIDTAAKDTVGGVLKAMARAPRSIRALDVGCGVGRLMEPLADAGWLVDGVDISERMIEFARLNPKLTESTFFVSRGGDCGAAPDAAYDLVYSQLCFRYVQSRTVRNELLRAMARALKPEGVVVVEMRFFPEFTTASLPAPHVPWSADHFDGTAAPAHADVCPTADELQLVYADFARHFQDVRLQVVTMPAGYRQTHPPHLIVSGSSGGVLWARMNGEADPAAS